MKAKYKKVKIAVAIIILFLVIGIMNFQTKKGDKVKVLVYNHGHGDYIEKLFYCHNNTKNTINNLQNEIKISHSQTRACREIAIVNGRLCVQEKCKISYEMENCVNACQNEAFINIHCDDKDNQLDALRKELYATVQKNCVE